MQNADVSKIINSLQINGDYEISLACTDNQTGETIEYNGDHFIYPASIYKMFVVAEVLRQIESENLSLSQEIEIVSPNDVDKIKSELGNDVRPFLNAGDTPTLEYLIDLVLTRSDNTASNTLIDLVGRESINKNIIKVNDWQGSEVTRKYLARDLEEDKYKDAPVTLSCANHLANFFYKLERGEIPGKEIIKKYSEISYNQRKKGPSFEEGVIFYRKGGWTATRLRDGRFIKYQGFTGIVQGGGRDCSIAVLTILKTDNFTAVFPIQELSEEIYRFCKK